MWVTLECYLIQNMRPRAENEGSKHTLGEDCLAWEPNTFWHCTFPKWRGRLRPLCSQFMLSTHTGVTAFLVARGKGPFTKRMCLCPLVSDAVFPYQTWLFWKRSSPWLFTRLNLNLPFSFWEQERKFLSSRKCWRDLEGSGATRNGKVLSKIK